MFTVKFISNKQMVSIPLSGSTRLSEVFSKNNIPFAMPCGGNGKCLKCKVCAEGSLSGITSLEFHALSQAELERHIRLACMTYVTGDAQIRLPGNDSVSIMAGGHMPIFKLRPLGSKFGIAVDIGTTTVVAYLYDLKKGELLSSGCTANPQKVFGADVISRIEKSLEGKAGQLAECIVGCIEELSVRICCSRQIPPAAVDSLVVTGNTTMLYLLMQNDVTCLSRAPFKADTLFGGFSNLRLPALPNAVVYLPRCISSFVGADITTAILSSEMIDRDTCCALVDIGTNGEMALCLSGKIWCCSTAAGPAFEGVGIQMGMNASDGAIDRVFIQGGTIRFTTIGGVTARGICGSGIIDAAAVFATAGVIDETGAFRLQGHPFADCLRKINGEPAFRFAGSDVIITQKDIREIQLAKSAIRAGLEALLHEAGITPNEVDTFYIAGGFGSFINIDSAAQIGLFPREFKNRIVVLGNAAGMGACMILLSDAMREKSTYIAQCAETIELSISPFFMDTYIDNMTFETHFATAIQSFGDPERKNT